MSSGDSSPKAKRFRPNSDSPELGATLPIARASSRLALAQSWQQCEANEQEQQERRHEKQQEAREDALRESHQMKQQQSGINSHASSSSFAAAAANQTASSSSTSLHSMMSPTKKRPAALDASSMTLQQLERQDAEAADEADEHNSLAMPQGSSASGNHSGAQLVSSTPNGSSNSLVNATAIQLPGLHARSFASPSGARSMTGPCISTADTFTALKKQQPEIDEHYHRVAINYGPTLLTPEIQQCTRALRKALHMRRRFVWSPLARERDTTVYDSREKPEFIRPSLERVPKTKTQHTYRMLDGVFQVYEPITHTSAATAAANSPLRLAHKRSSSVALEEDAAKAAASAGANERLLFTSPSRRDFSAGMALLVGEIGSSPPMRSFCHNRLHLLESRFNLHELLNHELESLSQKGVPHRDFYNVRKVDGHVHHSACMNQKHLLRFIKHKLKTEPDEKVVVRNDQWLTLAQVFESLKLTAYDLNVDTLDMHADKTFHRFDKFNLKYNPIGESRLREIFLKYNNRVQGRYLAQLTQQVFDDLESNKYQFAEYRISIYGHSKSEWHTLATWICSNNLFHYNVRWLIQLPRLYSVYRATGQISNFQEMLTNIFEPLFDVTVNPQCDPELHMFLEQCVGFDLVDDESVRERPYNDGLPTPANWTGTQDPCYAFIVYYVYANLLVLNQLRQSLGRSTFALRPHAGEAGDVEHLACTFLCAASINHGLVLQKNPSIQYLYYLAQIGISMSPLSNNLLFLEYDKNPFPRFFARGLNVTLSTDDPLMIHVTREPLVEEYSVASQVWKLTSIDMAEVARASVLQSGFGHANKVHWLGNEYWIRGKNEISHTNVPRMRTQFRIELLREEMAQLSKLAEEEFVEDEITDPL